MADADFELTIVIDAVDDASPVLQALAAQITENFAAIAVQTQEAEVEIDRGLGSIAPLFSELALGADQVSVAFSQADAGLSLFDGLLITLQQDAGLATQTLDGLAAAGGAVADLGSAGGGSFSSGLISGFDVLSGGGGGAGGGAGPTGGSPLSGFDFLPTAGGGAPGGDLVSLGQQQVSLMGQLVDATRGGQGAGQVVQNNTFNGILDPSTIRDQIIPELERAVSRGTTLLGSP